MKGRERLHFLYDFLELYSKSRNGETCIQCCRWKFWPHEDCTKSNFTAYYVCDNSEADDE